MTDDDWFPSRTAWRDAMRIAADSSYAPPEREPAPLVPMTRDEVLAVLNDLDAGPEQVLDVLKRVDDPLEYLVDEPDVPVADLRDEEVNAKAQLGYDPTPAELEYRARIARELEVEHQAVMEMLDDADVPDVSAKANAQLERAEQRLEAEYRAVMEKFSSAEVQTLRAEVQALRAEVNDLKTNACTCEVCKRRIERLRDEADYKRARQIEALPVDERNKAIAALSQLERQRLCMMFSDRVGVVFGLPPDKREEYALAFSLDVQQRMAVAVRDLEAKGDLPEYVRVQYPTRRYFGDPEALPIQEGKIRIDFDAWKKLEGATKAIRDRVHERRWIKDHPKALSATDLPARAKGYHKGDKDVFEYRRSELLGVWTAVPAEFWQVMLELDEKLRTALADGVIEASPLAIEERRREVIAEWEDQLAIERDKIVERVTIRHTNYPVR